MINSYCRSPWSYIIFQPTNSIVFLGDCDSLFFRIDTWWLSPPRVDVGYWMTESCLEKNPRRWSTNDKTESCFTSWCRRKSIKLLTVRLTHIYKIMQFFDIFIFILINIILLQFRMWKNLTKWNIYLYVAQQTKPPSPAWPTAAVYTR